MRLGLRLRLAALAVVLAVLAAVGVGATGLLQGAEDASVGARFALRGDRPTDELLVVAIDEESFSAARGGHQWPFPRSWHAQVIDRLARAGARQIVYDVQFTEPTTPRQDNALVEASRRAGTVVFATTETGPGGETAVLGGTDGLRAARAGVGAANFPVSRGGVIGRVPPSWGGLASLATVAAARQGVQDPRAGFGSEGAWIDFRGPPGTVRTVSFADLRQGRVPAALIRGRTVVVGPTAPTLQDIHPTTVGARAQMAGAEVQANAVWTALHGLPLRDPPPWVPLVLLLVAAALPAAACLRAGAVGAIVVLPVALAGGVGGVQLAFASGTVLPVVGPLVALAASTLACSLGAYLLEQRERRRVSLDNARLELAVQERTRELADTQLEVVRRLARAAESRDGDTGAHVERMSAGCHALARAAGMAPADAEVLRHAALLHDVGKIGIPDAILNKPGRLDDAEWSIMQTHTTGGAALLAGSGSAVVQMGERIARTHHERWDGTGYPVGLAGEEIPIEGRICAICDVFDALLSQRVYKQAWTLDAALEVIREGRGTHFDPHLVDCFVTVAAELAATLSRVEEARPVAALTVG